MKSDENAMFGRAARTRAIASVHGGEDAVGTRLHRQVQIGHQLAQIAMGRDQARLHVAGMTGGVTQAGDLRQFGHALEQSSERPGPAVGAFAMIGIDVLADQRDLAHARVGETLDLGQDVHHRPRHFCPARIGHDAERAELVAAFLHGDEGGYAARADRLAAWRLEEAELILDRKLGVDHGALALGAGEQMGEAMVALRPDHEIDHRRAADDLLPLGLGDAARDRNRQPASFAGRGLLEHADAAKLGIDLVRRLLADVAGVEDDEIGVLDPCGLGETFGRERVRHTMGIVDVHLATEGFDVELAGSAHAGRVSFGAKAPSTL
jgi:hypothetical protein